MRPLLLALAAATLIARAFAQNAPTANRAIFFTEPAFKGDQLVVEAGAEVPDLAAQLRSSGRTWRGAVCSFRLEGAATVVAFAEAGFRGDRLEAAASVPDLYAQLRGKDSVDTWEKAIASLRVAGPRVTVVAAPPPSRTVIITEPMPPPRTVVIVQEPPRPRYDFRTAELIVRREYLDLFGREPDWHGLRAWRERLVREGWSEREFREQLRRSDEFRTQNIEELITRAYRDNLGRAPDPEGFRNYRRLMLDHGWSIGQVRADIARSGERREVNARLIITRAYQDLLHREPDPEGYAVYEARIRREGWSERQVRDAIARSPEYREKNPGRR